MLLAFHRTINKYMKCTTIQWKAKIKKYAFLKEQSKHNLLIEEGGERWQSDNTEQKEREEERITNPNRKSETKYKMPELIYFWDRLYTWCNVRVGKKISEEDSFLLPLKRERQ